MNIATLYPPNSHLLREDVVATAMHCTRRAKCVLVAKENLDTYQSHVPDCSFVKDNVPRVWEDSDSSHYPNLLPSEGETSLPNDNMRGIEVMDKTSLKRLQLVAIDNMVGSPIEATNDSSSYKRNAESLVLGVRFEREKRYEPQLQYRKKKEDHDRGLDKDVQDLRDEIKILEMRRLRVSPAVPAWDRAWDTVMGYFRLVRHRLPLSSDLLCFVGKTMASNVVYNSEYGIEAMVRSWYFLQWFGDVKEELENVNKPAINSIVATTRTSVTITQQTLVNVFPHLLGDGDIHLRGKLLGQRIVMRGTTCFVWGGANERVASVIAQSDMLTPMLHLLGNWKDTSRVFEMALISPDFQWRSMGST